MKTVEVTWLDAHCSTDDTTIDAAKKQKPIKTFTVGYLVAENDEGVILATDRYAEDPKTVRMTNFVPWGMIEKYEVWEDG